MCLSCRSSCRSHLTKQCEISRSCGSHLRRNIYSRYRSYLSEFRNIRCGSVAGPTDPTRQIDMYTSCRVQNSHPNSLLEGLDHTDLSRETCAEELAYHADSPRQASKSVYKKSYIEPISSSKRDLDPADQCRSGIYQSQNM